MNIVHNFFCKLYFSKKQAIKRKGIKSITEEELSSGRWINILHTQWYCIHNYYTLISIILYSQLLYSTHNYYTLLTIIILYYQLYCILNYTVITNIL